MPLILVSVGMVLWHLYIAAFLVMLLAAFDFFFFRNPERGVSEEVSDPEKVVVAPADGKVILVDEDHLEGDFLRTETIKLSIFMSIFDVHVNRVPVSGEILQIQYRKGKFHIASKEEASRENEKNAVIIKTNRGFFILVVQVAGIFARRIVCWVKEGDKVVTGQRFGMVKFGSRVDLYLPKGSSLNVNVGRKVKAGETIVGFLP